MPVFNIPFGLVYLLNGVGKDEVAKSLVCGLWDQRSRLDLIIAHITIFTGEWNQKGAVIGSGPWDPRYFDGGYDMIASLQYDLFPFHPDDTPFFSDENSGSSSPQVGENDVDGIIMRYMDKLDVRKASKMRVGCKKKYRNRNRDAKTSLEVKAGSRLAIFEPA